MPACVSEGCMVDRDQIEGLIRDLWQYAGYLQDMAFLDRTTPAPLLINRCWLATRP